MPHATSFSQNQSDVLLRKETGERATSFMLRLLPLARRGINEPAEHETQLSRMRVGPFECHAQIRTRGITDCTLLMYDVRTYILCIPPLTRRK